MNEDSLRVLLGQHIRQLRLQKGIGQEECADIAGIHRNHIGLIERGKLDARISTLQRVALALDTTLVKLVDF